MTAFVASLRTAFRFVRVTWQFFPLILAVLRDRRRFILVGQSRRQPRAVHERRADRLVEILIELGPTFIKIGQLLSTRPDVLPPVYIERLGTLQDDVPPAPWEKTRDQLQESLGPVEEHFSAFETDAISGASLGQVYRASIDGTPVAVKVRRPGITRRVETDLRVLAVAVPVLAYFLDESRAFSLENLADEFATVIREEMDYDRERRMLEEIRSNFTEDETVLIPRAIDSHCTERVLTMEYIEGVKITDVETLDRRGIDRTAVAERLERAYLQMVLEDGVFHADPHPGNLAVTDEGRIVFYDFGMSGRVPAGTQDMIVRFYLAVAERDIQGILDAMIDLGTLSPAADRQLMGEVLELALQDARGEEVDEWRVQQIVSRIESTMYEFPLRLPARLALVLRVATVVEGVCVTLDEDFDFVEVATAFMTERGFREESLRRAMTETGEAARRAGFAALRTVPKAERVLDRIEQDRLFVRAGIDDRNAVLDRFALRLLYGMGGVAGLLGASIIYAARGVDPAAGGFLLLAAVAGLLLVRSFRGSRTVTARPQFTRQALRKRRRK